MIRTTAFAILSVIFAVPACAQSAPENSDRQFSVLWDSYSAYSEWDWQHGHFDKMGKELQDMGATITDLWPGQLYTDERLADIDLVIICLRLEPLQASEQVTLVRYVRNGGSLLVMCKYYESLAAANPVLINFGIQGNGNISDVKNLDVFAHPATTLRRPVSDVVLDDPRIIMVDHGAKGIAGWSQNTSPPATMAEVIFALGSKTGGGGVIATTGSNVWLSKLPYCGYPFWGYADNTDLFHNVIEYLLGVSDLQLRKLKFKKAAMTGGELKIKARIGNLESDYSRESTVAFYLSLDASFQEEKDISLGTATIPPIRGRGSKLVKYTATIPDANTGEDWYIIGVINPLDDWLEVNQQNNLASRAIILY